MWRVMCFFMIFKGVGFCRCEFLDCHDDPAFELDEGPFTELQFTWLGTLQYIHIKNGTPHYFRVPRVVLISRQFVLSTAMDAAQIPEGYALGNVAFGEYERDEGECGVSVDALAAGADCEPAALLVPISDVLLHPEYKHFRATHSIALLKLVTLVKSHYMLPGCLPFKNHVIGRDGLRSEDTIWHIDFSNDESHPNEVCIAMQSLRDHLESITFETKKELSADIKDIDVPRDIVDEEKEATRIETLPKELCFQFDNSKKNATDLSQTRVMCSTGCGFNSGAPSVVHEHTGHWSIVAISYGGSVCPDPLRRRKKYPPRHILLYPYVQWITAAISGKPYGKFARDDPFGFIMPRASQVSAAASKWSGHWWMAGLRCYDRGEAAENLFRFYHEIFVIKPRGELYLTYFLELYAAYDTTITCVKVGMPYRLGNPRIWDLDSPDVKVRIPVMRFNFEYKFFVEAWAFNTTYSKDASSCKGASCPESSPEVESKSKK